MDEHATRRRLEGERLRLQAARDLLHEAVATATVEGEVDLGALEAVDGELRAIAAAEARIAAGTYGRCETCGAPIGAARLRAIPWTTRCLADELQAEILEGARPAEGFHGPLEIEVIGPSDRGHAGGPARRRGSEGARAHDAGLGP